MLQNKRMAEVAGWYGIGAVLGTYALASFGIISIDSLLFQALNATGSGGLIWISAVKRVRQLVVFNIIWTSVALISIVRLLI